MEMLHRFFQVISRALVQSLAVESGAFSFYFQELVKKSLVKLRGFGRDASLPYAYLPALAIGVKKVKA